MRRNVGWIIIVLASVGMGIGFAIVGRQVVPMAMAPQLSVSAEVVEFGQTSVGQEESVSVFLKNRGHSVLVISNIHVSCGCTTVALETGQLPPGSTSRLFITASTARSSLAQRSTVTIFSNDPRRGKVVIDVIVRGTKMVGFAPSEVDFGRVESNLLPATELVMLQLESGLPTAKTGADVVSDLPSVSTEIVSWDVAANSLGVLVKLKESAPVGEIAGRLKVRFSGSNREHSARILACVVGDYFAEPPAIVWGPIRKDDSPSTQAIRVQARSSKPTDFRITGTSHGPEWPGEALAVSATEGTTNPEIRLTLEPAKWSAPWSKQRLRTSVRISILGGDGKTSELNVPVELVLVD